MGVLRIVDAISVGDRVAFCSVPVASIIKSGIRVIVDIAIIAVVLVERIDVKNATIIQFKWNQLLIR